MKNSKKYFCVGLAITFSILEIGCGEPKETVKSSAVSSVSDTTAEKYYDIPAGFTKGYDQAVFEKYNSPAEENGLGGSKIWIEGTVENVFTSSGTSGANIITEDDNKWLVILDSEDEEPTYETLEGNVVCMIGIYEGFSELYQQPTMTLNKLFDENSGDIISSLFYADYEGDSITITSDFDESTNQKESFEDWLTYQIPESWGEKTISSDKKYTYYYPDQGMLMVYVQPSLTVNSMSEEDADDFFCSCEQSIDDYVSLARDKYSLKNDDRTAYLDEFTGIISGREVHSKNFVCPSSRGAINFTYCDYADSSYDRMEDFDQILQSIVIKEDKTEKEPKKKTESSSKKKTSDSSATTGELNALSSAKSYLSFSAFSYKGLIEQLEYEGYTTEEATYGADNCGANWKEQAVKSAKDYLKVSAFSYNGLIEQLEYSGFSNEEATYGADNCKADWKEQAVKSAKSYLEFSSFSHSDLVDQLIYEGFTAEQAEYGVSQNGL